MTRHADRKIYLRWIFYNLLKKIQVEHDNYRFDLVAYFEDEGSETVVGFGVDTWVENASFCENNIKLAIMDIEDFNEDHELSFKNVLISLENQLDKLEETLNKKMRVKVESSSINFEYKGFWVESESFDQAEKLEEKMKKKIDKYIKNQKKEKK